MQTITTVSKMRRYVKGVKSKTIGFVPTMGALHKGHISLIRRARRENKVVVVSIFVNPAQFGPGEDFKRYPRDLKRDKRLLMDEGVDALFVPSAKEIYPEDVPGTFVEVQDLSGMLCGVSRASHFQGVATVVTKLFNIVNPDTAYFGQKDYQQAIIIKKLVRDLNMDIKLKVCPVVREKDGLAISSRNVYLDKEQRRKAPILYKALREARQMARSGVQSSGKIISVMRNIIDSVGGVRIDYLKVVDAEILEEVKRIKGKIVIALAAYVGRVRLIDNIIC